MKLRFHYLYLIIAVLILSACSNSQKQVLTINGKTMGTTYSVKYVNDPSSQQIAPQALADVLDARLVDINQLMSTYIPDSELSRLNNAPAGESFPVSAETASVIEEAVRLHVLSDGRLDVTIGPVVNLWGFGPDQRPSTVPSAEQINAAKRFVGAEAFTLSNSRITKAYDEVYIDLSTIAKGYAVDELAKIFGSYGIDNYLVEIGGEMRVSGKKPESQDWVIAIEKPISTERAIQRTISIGDNAIASSGDYRNYYEENGQRYSHLIDPATGYPIEHNLVSVSVIAPSAMFADGMATALIVMGAEEGKALAESEGIAALFITKEGDEFIEHRSSTFERSVSVIQ